MSLGPRVLCRTGCGEFGDVELDYLCVDCHGDRIEAAKQQELREYISKTSQNVHTPTTSSPTRRGPPSIDHKKALQHFLNQQREKDPAIILQESLFLQREMEMCEASKKQLRKYMIATDMNEPVDSKEWGRYKYGAPRNIPRYNVDQSTERIAQLKLFCAWRRRLVNRRIETKRQLLETERKEQRKSVRNLKIMPSFRVKYDGTKPQTPNVTKNKSPRLLGWKKQSNKSHPS